jgi:hypothetical protein
MIRPAISRERLADDWLSARPRRWPSSWLLPLAFPKRLHELPVEIGDRAWIDAERRYFFQISHFPAPPCMVAI